MSMKDGFKPQDSSTLKRGCQTTDESIDLCPCGSGKTFVKCHGLPCECNSGKPKYKCCHADEI